MSADNDFKLLRERLVAGFLQKIRLSNEEVTHWMRTQNSDGSWSDIDYANTAAALWDPNRHLTRLSQMLLRYCDSQSVDFLSAVHRGFLFWCEREPLSTNWWFNQIGVPMEVGRMLLLLGSEVSGSEKCAGLDILRRSGWFIWKGKGVTEPIDWTGANLLWIASIILMRAVLELDGELVSDVCRRVAGEIRIAGSGEEGIREDYSFHQHGPLLYNGGYGSSFASECLRLVSLTAGTRWEFPEAKRELLAAFLLDGQQWMRWGDTWDYSVCDRIIAREAPKRPSAKVEADFSFLGGKRRAELARYAASLNNWPEIKPRSGNRFFWCSDFMVHRREGYSTSLRMSSVRTRTSECCNEEGKLSHHIADGATYLYKSGGEYRDIFPIWDWRRVPGTTCVQRETLPREELGWQTGGPRTGGLSDGSYGLAAQEITRPELKARKAWFYFDEGCVCLGAGITSEHQEKTLTSIEQRWADGEALVEKGDRLVEVAGADKGQVIWHGGVGYICLSDAIVQNKTQSGSWTRIAPGPEGEISGKVFSAWIDHGAQPQDASYAYAVLPEIGGEELLEASRRPFFKVLSNTSVLQAVEHSGLGMIQAVFWQPGELQVPGGCRLSVDGPCLVLLRLRGAEQIAVGDLERLAPSVKVVLSESSGKVLIDREFCFDLKG